jgi:K+-transporting ATPase KdpF subunit
LREEGGLAVSITNLVGLILAVVLTVFLVVALLLPEKF